MATIQAKTSRGHKYWYIVESRRVNGKPRPIVLAYLGKAEELLRRLQGLREQMRVKSYSHGAVAALLQGASELDLPARINRFIASPRRYVAKKPLRNHLTAGITLVLGGIGRVCMPTSKRGWWTWARTTSCEYLLGVSLAKVDSQHFWDLMDVLPCDSIEKIENELLQETFTKYGGRYALFRYDELLHLHRHDQYEMHDRPTRKEQTETPRFAPDGFGSGGHPGGHDSSVPCHLSGQSE